MPIHIPENTDISGFTIIDFLPPDRRCRNGQIVPAWDKCLEDYQISPPGQARKAEFGLGGLSKIFLKKLKSAIAKKAIRKVPKPGPAAAGFVTPSVQGRVYAGGKSPLDLTNPVNIAMQKRCAARGLGFKATVDGPICTGVMRPAAPLITKPSMTQAEVDADRKLMCENGGGTWVPAKLGGSRRRPRMKWGYCQRKLSDCGCEG